MRAFLICTTHACDCCGAPTHPAGCISGGAACCCDQRPWHPARRFLYGDHGKLRCRACTRCPEHCECRLRGWLAACPQCGYPWGNDTSEAQS